MSSSISSAPPIERKLAVSVCGDRRPERKESDLVHATIGREIKCDQSLFDSFSYEGWQDVHYDLLIVCAAVEIADRRWDRGNQRWSRRLQLQIPVRELALWNSSLVQSRLQSVLRHLTGDDWQFEFVLHSAPPVSNPRQRPLIFNEKKDFAIAYSDGLDSLCVSNLLNQTDSGMRVRVARNRQRRRKDERPFDSLPFYVTVTPNEDSARSRGFKFGAVTAIAAHISGVGRILVPESGQGALGPVLVPLRHIYPDYRNHPTFFRLMEAFIQSLLNVELRYEQPRLWNTKGQSIADYLALPGSTAGQLFKTRSCWQQRANVRVAGELRQCGVCAACQLRRMSLHAAGITEPDGTYVLTDLHAHEFEDALPRHLGFNPTGTLYEYGFMGTRHLQQLAALASVEESVLAPYVNELAGALALGQDETRSGLRKMLEKHSQEWRAFLSAQGDKSFLRFWSGEI